MQSKSCKNFSKKGDKTKSGYVVKLYFIAAIFIIICIVAAIFYSCSTSLIKQQNEEINSQLQELEGEIDDQTAQIEKILSEASNK